MKKYTKNSFKSTLTMGSTSFSFDYNISWVKNVNFKFLYSSLWIIRPFSLTNKRVFSRP